MSREGRECHEQQDNSPISHLDFAHQDDVLCEYPHRQGLMIVHSHETQLRQTHKERYERIFMTCPVVDACGVPKAVKARESRREHFNQLFVRVMKVDVIRVTRCSGMILTSHTGMAQARRQLPVTEKKEKKRQIFCGSRSSTLWILTSYSSGRIILTKSTRKK